MSHQHTNMNNITNAIDFLYKRIESSETMAEKERVLELLFEECEKVRARRNLEELKHLRNLMSSIRDKYCDR
jgi:hypothetical protein